MVLTNEEKLIKDFYSKVKRAGRNERKIEKLAEDFAIEYVEAVKKNTKYENEKITVLKQKGKQYGSMSTSPNGYTSKLAINFSKVLHDKVEFTDGSSISYGLAEKNPLRKFMGLREFIDTLNHETEHFFQTKNAENFIITEKGMKFADMMQIIRENAAHSVEPKLFYSENYDQVYAENDANRVGSLKTAKQLIKIYPNMSDKEFNIIVDNMIRTIRYRSNDIGKLTFADGEEYERDDIASQYTDEWVASDPSRIQKRGFYALLQEYHEDGTRRNFVDVVNLKDKAILKIKNNSKITEETRIELLNQVRSGFAGIMNNSLRRCTPKERNDLRKIMGDEQYSKQLSFIYNGYIDRAKQKEKELENFADFLRENASRIPQRKKAAIQKAYNKAVEELGVVKRVDSNGIEYTDLNESKNIKFILKHGSEVEKTFGQLGRYNEAEKEEALKEMDSQLKLIRDKDKKTYEERKKRQELEKEQEQTNEEKPQRIVRRRLRTPLEIIKLLFNKDKRKMLDSAPQHKAAPEELIKEVEEKIEEKESLENEYDEKLEKFKIIEKEASPLLEQFKSQQIVEKEELSKQEEMPINNKEDIGG